ncbi:hypothetical protein Tco_1272929 [Tanacetum coccineum]
MARGRRRRGGITGRELLSYARLEHSDVSTNLINFQWGGNTRKEGLLNAPQGTRDEIVSDSTSNGNGNETSCKNVVVTNSGSRSTIESSHNLSLTEGGRKQLSFVNGFLENSSQCSRVITKIFKERIVDGAFTWRKETTLKRPPNPFELFVYTHTKNHDKETFIDKKAKTINAFAYYPNPSNRSSATYIPHVPLENKYLEMERKLTRKVGKQQQILELLCSHLDIPVPSTESDTKDNNEADTIGGTQNPNTSNSEEHEV